MIALWNRSSFTPATRSTSSTQANRARLHHRLTSGKKNLLPGAASAKTASSTAAAASTSAVFAAAETRGFVMGSVMEQDPPCKVSYLTV